jgi:hypothetical protein
MSLLEIRALVSRQTRSSVTGGFVPLVRLFFGLACFSTMASFAYADFSSPYSVTPPAAGSYFVLAPTTQAFGAWTCLPTARGERVDTTSAPLSLVLDTELVNRPVGGYFFARAADAGVVSFEYSISGQGVGTFGWFNSGPVFNYPTPNVSIPDLVSTPTAGSFSVAAGDVFGFYVSAQGDLTSSAQRLATIQSFSAPVPEPSTMALGLSVLALTLWQVRRKKGKGALTRIASYRG